MTFRMALVGQRGPRVRNGAGPATQEGTPVLPVLLTPKEVAAWLRTTVQAVYAKAERGTLPGATRVGRRLYFLRAELLGLVVQGRVPHLGGPGGGT